MRQSSAKSAKPESLEYLTKKKVRVKPAKKVPSHSRHPRSNALKSLVNSRICIARVCKGAVTSIDGVRYLNYTQTWGDPVAKCERTWGELDQEICGTSWLMECCSIICSIIYRPIALIQDPRFPFCTDSTNFCEQFAQLIEHNIPSSLGATVRKERKSEIPVEKDICHSVVCFSHPYLIIAFSLLQVHWLSYGCKDGYVQGSCCSAYDFLFFFVIKGTIEKSL